MYLMSNYFQPLFIHVRKKDNQPRGVEGVPIPPPPPHTDRTAPYGAVLKQKVSCLDLSSKNVICFFDL